MAVHGDDFITIGDVEGLSHVDGLLQSKYVVKVMGTLGFESGDDVSLNILNRTFRVGRDADGEYLDIEADGRHVPLIIAEAGCDGRTKAVATPREKLKDAVVLENLKSKVLDRERATRYRSASMRLSYLAQDRMDLVEVAKCLAQRMAEPREADFGPHEAMCTLLAVTSACGGALQEPDYAEEVGYLCGQ